MKSIRNVNTHVNIRLLKERKKKIHSQQTKDRNKIRILKACRKKSKSRQKKWKRDQRTNNK